MSSTVKSRILRGVGATALGQVANAAIQLVSLPVFLAVWGVEQYGEWLVLSSLAAFLSMSDVGFATAAANEMTMRVGRGDRPGAVTVYHSMWALLTGLGLAVLAVVLAILWATPAAGWIPLATITPAEAAAVLSVLTVYILIGLQLGVANAGFRCDGNFALGQLLGTGQRLAEFAAQLTAAAATQSMLAVATAGLAVRAASLVVSLAVLRRKSPWLPLGMSGANRVTVRELFVPAATFMGMPLGYALGNQGMIQVVGATLGPAAVVIFSAHRTIANVAVQLISVINQAVWPELSRAYGAGDKELMRRLHRRSCQWSIWLCICGCGVLLLTGPYIIELWSRGAIRTNYNLLVSFLAMILLRSVWRASAVVPISANRLTGVTATFVSGTAASCLLAVPVAKAFGLVGVAWTNTAVDVLMTIAVLRCSMSIVQDSLGGFVGVIWKPPVTAASARRWIASTRPRMPTLSVRSTAANSETIGDYDG